MEENIMRKGKVRKERRKQQKKRIDNRAGNLALIVIAALIFFFTDIPSVFCELAPYLIGAALLGLICFVIKLFL